MGEKNRYDSLFDLENPESIPSFVELESHCKKELYGCKACLVKSWHHIGFKYYYSYNRVPLVEKKKTNYIESLDFLRIYYNSGAENQNNPSP